MKSGLDRLSEDLRVERQKASSALQDRARLRVEIEGLKQKVQLSEKQIDDVSNALDDRITDLNNANSKINEMDRQHAISLEQHNEVEVKLRSVEEKNKILRQEKQAIALDLDHAEAEVTECRDIIVSSELQIVNKTKMMEDFKEQLAALEKQHEEQEERNFYLTDQIRQKTIAYEEIKDSDNKVEALQNSNMYLNQTMDELKNELDAAYSKNTSLQHELREEKHRYEDRELKDEVTKSQLETVTKDRNRLKSEAEDWEKAHDELAGRVAAEIEAAERSRAIAESAQKEASTLVKRIDELTQTYQNSCIDNEKLLSELTQNKLQFAAVQQELQSATDRASEADRLQTDLQHSQETCRELELVRSQYMDLRKQVIRRDMEEGVNELATTMSAEQKQSTHELIIEDLRKELTEMHDHNAAICKELDASQKRLEATSKLEEDMLLLRETAQIITAERNSASLTATEAAERSMKTLHSRDLLVRDLHRAESEVMNSKDELSKLKDELVTERQKYRQLHVEKLGCERAAAECVAANARAEASMEEEKEKFTITSIEMERGKRTVKEQNIVIEKLRRQLNELVQEQANYYGSSSTSRIVMSSTLAGSQIEAGVGGTSSSPSRYSSPDKSQSRAILAQSIIENSEVENLRNENQLLLHSKDLLTKEIETLKKSVLIQRKGFDNALAETVRLHQMCESLKSELKSAKNWTAKESNEFEDSENKVRRLRSELDQTLSKWTKADDDHSQKNNLITQLQGELSREREKAYQLRSHVGMLDSRLNEAMGDLTSSRHMSETEKEEARIAIVQKLSEDTGRMENYSELYESRTPASQESKSVDDDDCSYSSDAHYHPHSGNKLSMSDFHVTPSRYDTSRNHSKNNATFGHFRSSERAEMLIQHQAPNAKKSASVLDTKEQLRRRREKRDKQRFASLRGEAFYNASKGMTVLPAKLDFQQAKELLQSKQALR